MHPSTFTDDAHLGKQDFSASDDLDLSNTEAFSCLNPAIK